MVYRKNGGFSGVKNGQCAPRFVPFCSMYGDLLSYPLTEARLETRAQMGRGGALCAPRAPLVASNLSWSSSKGVEWASLVHVTPRHTNVNECPQMSHL